MAGTISAYSKGGKNQPSVPMAFMMAPNGTMNIKAMMTIWIAALFVAPAIPPTVMYPTIIRPPTKRPVIYGIPRSVSNVTAIPIICPSAYMMDTRIMNSAAIMEALTP